MLAILCRSCCLLIHNDYLIIWLSGRSTMNVTDKRLFEICSVYTKLGTLFISLHACLIYVICVCLARLFLQLFVGGLMSYLRYLCLFAHSVVQHILCCVFVLFFFVLCTLYCQFLWESCYHRNVAYFSFWLIMFCVYI